MIRAESSIEIDRPPSQVFAWVCDLQHAPEWLEACKELALVKPGWARGAELRYVFREGKGEGRMSGVVSEYDAFRRLVMDFMDPRFGVSVSLDFAPAGTGTRVTHAIAIDAKGLMGKLMGPMIRAGNEKQVKANLARLEQGLMGAGHAA
jgi:carbon monoxide dehydrogenase subunit G